MKPIEFDWKEGTTSLVWEAPHIGIVRFHVKGDTDAAPKYRGVCLVVRSPKSKLAQKIIDFLQRLNAGTLCEFKAMVCKPRPYPEEHKNVKGYLENMGLELFSRRLKRDGSIVVKKY